MNITIRQARSEDAHVIAEAEREIAREPGFFCSQSSELTDENVLNTILTFLKQESGIYFVAEVEGQIVGHAFLEFSHLQSLHHIAELNLAVHKGWQKKGIGTKLLTQIIAWAKKSDRIEKIQLNVRASNLPAIALYKKMGFEEEGRLKNRLKVANHHYIDDLVMGLDVKSHGLEEKNDFQKVSDDLATIMILPAMPSELESLNNAITHYNIHVASNLPLAEIYRLDFSAKNQKGELLGGIQAKRVNWGILHIELLFVFEPYRHHGIASHLLQHVEKLGCQNKCHIAHLSTFDFQAKDFYLKQGYAIFGTLENAPKGHCRYYMKKDL